MLLCYQYVFYFVQINMDGWILETTFPSNHLSVTSKTKYNYNERSNSAKNLYNSESCYMDYAEESKAQFKSKAEVTNKR